MKRILLRQHNFLRYCPTLCGALVFPKGIALLIFIGGDHLPDAGFPIIFTQLTGQPSAMIIIAIKLAVHMGLIILSDNIADPLGNHRTRFHIIFLVNKPRAWKYRPPLLKIATFANHPAPCQKIVNI